jgi:hypothetical protein
MKELWFYVFRGSYPQAAFMFIAGSAVEGLGSQWVELY